MNFEAMRALRSDHCCKPADFSQPSLCVGERCLQRRAKSMQGSIHHVCAAEPTVATAGANLCLLRFLGAD